ncbi:Hypothetical predicted protein, partial [Pelobates cultripes]
MTPRDFAHYEDNNLHRVYRFYKDQQIIPFTELPQTVSFTTRDYFRYIQIKNFLETTTYKQAGRTPLTPFEKSCIHTPIRKSQISTTYTWLLTATKKQPLNYITA